jgi:hypothetical protein
MQPIQPRIHGTPGQVNANNGNEKKVIGDREQVTLFRYKSLSGVMGRSRTRLPVAW